MARTLPMGDGTGRSINEIMEAKRKEEAHAREKRIQETERQLRAATDALAARLAAGEKIPGVNS